MNFLFGSNKAFFGIIIVASVVIALMMVIAKGVVTYGLELMMAVFQIVQGVISKIMRTSGLGGASTTKLPNVNHPSHYTDGNIEVIDFIEDKNLSYHLDNAVKYISRAG